MNVTLASLAAPRDTQDRLAARGFSPDAAAAKARLVAACALQLLDAGCPADAEAYGVFVPGRIEVLGKHTDYAGGRSLIAAAEQGICLVAVPRLGG